jgi:hypothetical protein
MTLASAPLVKRVSAGTDSVLVINNLRRRAIRLPLKWPEYRDLMQGRNVRPDLAAHIGLNGRVVYLRCAYYSFPDPENRWPPTLTLIAFSPGEMAVTGEEATWIRDRFFRPCEDVRDTSKDRYRAYTCSMGAKS